MWLNFNQTGGWRIGAGQLRYNYEVGKQHQNQMKIKLNILSS